MKEKLKQLYKSVILKHNNNPFHYEKKDDAAYQLDAYNPLCGDRFNLYLDIKDGVIESVHFHGYGCAISKASTSVLAQHLEGKTIEEALALCDDFQKVVLPDSSEIIENESFEAFAAARDFPGRLQCATLSWEVTTQFLLDKKSTTD